MDGTRSDVLCNNITVIMSINEVAWPIISLSSSRTNEEIHFRLRCQKA